MKGIAVKIAIPTYLTTYLLGFSGLKIIFYNEWSYKVNFPLLLISTIVICILLTQVKFGYKTLILVTIASFVILGHLSNSTMIDIVHKQVISGKISRDGFGLSWVFIIPISMIYLLVIGLITDKLKRKTMPNNGEHEEPL